MNVLDLFSGIGGFSLGLERAGMKTVAFCEIEPYLQQLLKQNFPGVPVYGNVKQLTAEQLKKDGIPKIDVLCGGFPCQPYSVSGLQLGKHDPRDLLPDMLRIIEEVKPDWVIAENSHNVVNMAFTEIKTHLEEIGYEVGEPLYIPACAVGADHRRKRAWICAYSNKGRLQRRGIETFSKFAPLPLKLAGIFEIERSRRSISEPRMLRSYNGLPDGVDRIKALGNSLMPQIPEIFGRAIMQIENFVE